MQEISTRERETRIKMESRTTNYAHLYEKGGWANMLQFDARIDDLDIEAHVKKLSPNQVT